MITIIRTVDNSTEKKKSRRNSFYYLLALLLFLVAALEFLALNNKFGYADNKKVNEPVTAGNKVQTAAENKKGSEDIISEDKKSDNIKIVIKEVSGAPSLTQMPELPSGCEAVATTMLLQWAGVKISSDEVAVALPKGSVPYRQSGSIYGSNPENVFIGDPFSDNGLGVYHKPIASLVGKYLPGMAKDISSTEFSNVLKEVDGGRPVVVWATMNMAEPSLIASWYDKNGTKVKWIAPEHAFLLTGYTSSDVIVNDPYTGKRQIYPIELFKSRWESMGRQAVTVSSDIPGRVVVTDVTSLSDAKSLLGLKGVDTSQPKAPVVKKAEQAISEMSKPDANTSNGGQFKIHFKEIYNEITVTLHSWYDGIVKLIKK